MSINRHTPEIDPIKLIVGVIAQAIIDAASTNKTLAKRALKWLKSRACKGMCATADLEHFAVLRALKNLQKIKCQRLLS